ncbi:RagB/SusD family nutrient uptake outer membrane protein [Pontibacter beigongshangensis]|uniref:RagB/SusD family nutrient uptake outer membrane protein n=1 Tax=Pontibacter beigongshangensis TaxID=2574733 RepID=UPI00164FD5DE|nr:RagB/SusD family nutrient uptake outer membrane protein [Pontibacter beigongshangensis]
MKSLKYIALSLALAGCTDLAEQVHSELPSDKARAFLEENVNFPSMLERVYRDFDNPFVQHGASVWVIDEISGDAMICPSRPSGWDNGGVYRDLHQHTWRADHAYLRQVWERMNRGVFDATNVLNFNPTPEVAAEARFLRAYFMFTLLDLYDRVPYREPGSNLLNPPVVYTGTEAINFIIKEVEEALPLLSDTAPAFKASKNAARGFLTRLYLNKGVYADRANPQFNNADLDKVIQYADAITGKSINFYWDSFGPDNNTKSTELLFTIEGQGGVRSHSLYVLWNAIFPGEMTLPNGGGWNGFAAVGDFYDTFEQNDIRRYYEHPITKERGYNAGFLVGQQYNPNGEPIPNVVFTKEIPTIVGAGLFHGVRPVKYIPDYVNKTAADNDYALIRYTDVLLMKAEALLRKGMESEALAIVNSVRTNRGVAAYPSLTLDNLLAERGRELNAEGLRRTDLVRYGKFLQPWHLKPASDPKRLVFPVPPADVLANPNLEQNPGY